ncbi:MAG: hypothetical protein IPL57_17535 [Rubrivivax sp.]|nr:hypothetical protein [Rubrivivax sp.]
MATSSWRSRPFSSRSHAVKAVGALLCWLLVVAGWAQAAEALSGDGQWRLRSLDGPPVGLQLLDGRGVIVRSYVARSLAGAVASGVELIVANPARRAFVIAFAGLDELWDLSLDPGAEPIFNGWVHDYRMGEGVAEPGHLGVRRVKLPAPLLSLAIDASGAYVLGRAHDLADGRAVLHLLQLDVRRSIARFEVDADPDLSQARSDRVGDQPLLVIPDRRGGAPLRLDLRAARLQPG